MTGRNIAQDRHPNDIMGVAATALARAAGNAADLALTNGKFDDFGGPDLAGSWVPGDWPQPGRFDAMQSATVPAAAAMSVKGAPGQVLYLQEAGTNAPISVSDINQGQLGDCFLLAAIGEITLNHPGAITGMISTDIDGTENVTLYEDASGSLVNWGSTAFRPVSVNVTNSFPSDSVNNGATQDVLNRQKEIWVQVLEKATATLEGGYDAIANGGYPVLAMEQLTGQVAGYISPSALNLGYLQSCLAAGDLIVCDTPQSGSLPFNLVDDHAYMFESLTMVNGTPMVQLGNPWGYDQPNLIPLSQLATGITEVDIGNWASLPALTIRGVVALQAVTDETSILPFSGLGIASTASGQSVSATVTLSAAANGTLSNVGIGSYSAASGIYTVAGTAAAVTAALDRLVFDPTAHQTLPGSAETTSLDIQVSNATSVANTTTSIVTTAVSDAPLISGTMATQAVSDTLSIEPFASVAIIEPDFGQLLSATVTLSAAANGTLSNLGAGNYNAGSGIYTVSGTTAAINTALDNVVFNPTAYQAAPGGSETTGFSIGVRDTAGAFAFDATTSVIAAAASGTSYVVSAGQELGGAVVGAADSVLVLSGGVIHALANSGSIDTLEPGAVGYWTTLSNGGSENVNGGISNFSTINNGSQTINRGSAIDTVVDSGGLQTIASGGVSQSSYVLSGGTVDAYGDAQGAVVSSGGTLWVEGQSESATINGGIEYVYGTATSETIENGGYQLVDGTAVGTVLNQGGTQQAYGDERGTVINSGGEQDVGLQASGTIVNNGGIQRIGFGDTEGQATGTILRAGGIQILSYAKYEGAAYQTVVSSGGLLDDEYGLVSGAVILSGGSATISGSSNNDIISGGVEDVYGAASGITIGAGGIEYVHPGATTTASVIHGGALVLGTQGSATGGISFSGSNGLLDIGGTAMPATAIYGFGLTNKIDLMNLGYRSGATATLGLKNILSITGLQGGNATLAFDPSVNYAGKTFTLGYDNNTGTLLMVQPSSAPVARTDVYATTLNTSLSVNARSGVLGNDSDPAGHGLTALRLQSPLHGAVVLNKDGSFKYTPAKGFTGTDSFTYEALDRSIASAPAIVTLTVSAVPRPSVIGGAVKGQTTADSASIHMFSHVTISDPNAGATDSIVITLVGSNGKATDADGTISGPGLSKSAVGSYVLASAATATLTQQLQGMVFIPTRHQVPAGSAVTTGLTILDRNSTGLTTISSITSVIAKAALKAGSAAAGLSAADPLELRHAFAPKVASGAAIPVQAAGRWPILAVGSGNTASLRMGIGAEHFSMGALHHAGNAAAVQF